MDNQQEEVEVGTKRKMEDEEVECGREVVEDLSRAFRNWVEDRQWLNMRLCVSFTLSSTLALVSTPCVGPDACRSNSITCQDPSSPCFLDRQNLRSLAASV